MTAEQSGPKHTPGPWVSMLLGIVGPKCWKIYRNTPDGEAICQLFDKNHVEFLEAEANATLIVAAPDMLTTLREILTLARRGQDQSLAVGAATEHLATIELLAFAAITKAETTR